MTRIAKQIIPYSFFLKPYWTKTIASVKFGEFYLKSASKKRTQSNQEEKIQDGGLQTKKPVFKFERRLQDWNIGSTAAPLFSEFSYRSLLFLPT